jgi:hypothetical protein
MNKIKCAAIRVHNEIFVGRSHYEIMNKRDEDCNIILSKYDIIDMEYGFMTNTDKFVDRKEAAKIAYNAKQINKKVDSLQSDDIKQEAK